MACMQDMSATQAHLYKKTSPSLPARLPDLSTGQSICAQYVFRSAPCQDSFQLHVFPTRSIQDALSTFMLRLPREIRSLIYEHIYSMFKAYSGAFVTSDARPSIGNTYMLDTGAWYSIDHFRGETIDQGTILELDSAPWAHKNIPHLFTRTPARHLMALHPRLLDECIDDMCLKAGSVRLAMQYRNHENPHRYDRTLFDRFARHARQLTVAISYTGIYSRKTSMKAQSLGFNADGGSVDKLAVVDDLVSIFARGGYKTNKLSLFLTFDIPATSPGPSLDDCLNEKWLREQVGRLAQFGFDIELCVYNRQCLSATSTRSASPASSSSNVSRMSPSSTPRSECLTWGTDIYNHRASYIQLEKSWTPWSKHSMSAYEAAALDL